MRITIISQWYNDSFIAPFFLKHYAFADEIHILMETDTTDDSRELAEQYSNVVIEDVHCPGGHDDRCKTDNTNRAAAMITDGWIIPVDSDEFVFPEFFEDPKIFLERQEADVVMASFFYVYRHVSEPELDPEKEVIPQRIHGLNKGEGNNRYKFSKVGAYRAGKGINVTIGNHEFLGDFTVSDERFIGSHWNMADLKIAYRRLISRDRMSPNNKKHRYGWHNFRITKEKLLKELEENSNLPVLQEMIARKWI